MNGCCNNDDLFNCRSASLRCVTLDVTFLAPFRRFSGERRSRGRGSGTMSSSTIKGLWTMVDRDDFDSMFDGGESVNRNRLPLVVGT